MLQTVCAFVVNIPKRVPEPPGWSSHAVYVEFLRSSNRFVLSTPDRWQNQYVAWPMDVRAATICSDRVLSQYTRLEPLSGLLVWMYNKSYYVLKYYPRPLASLDMICKWVTFALGGLVAVGRGQQLITNASTPVLMNFQVAQPLVYSETLRTCTVHLIHHNFASSYYQPAIVDYTVGVSFMRPLRC